ncbi:ankyrin repeat domain-containing protein, partial [Aspergillus homomorphus CBS 101889]
GVDPNRCGPRKVSPLISALGKVHKDGGAVFDLLVEYGAKLDSGLFFNALVWGTNSAIKTQFLLSKGLDPNATTSAEWGTPLHAAVLFEHEQAIEALLAAGADPMARSECAKFGNRSPTELAESRLRRCSESSGMKDTCQRILKLL